MGVTFPPSKGAHGTPRLAHRAAMALFDALLRETDRWFLWIPVLFGCGIALYFARPSEPTILQCAGWVLGAVSLLMLSRSRPALWALAAAGLCVALGFANAKLRTMALDTPVLEEEIGAVTVIAHVEKVEPRGPKSYRLTLRVIAIPDSESEATPRKVRVTSRFSPAPATGDAVRLRAVLRPVPEPVMPGGFDFARRAWFQGVGASGFAISRHESIADAPPAQWWLRIKAAVDYLRTGVDNRIFAVLPGERGAIASALITGGQGGIPEPAMEAMRNSGLAHVLSISGLHMVLMAGSLYWLIRSLMAAWPAAALRLPIKKIAAAVALVGATFYLALSGAAVATQRAWLMMGIVFLAIMLDRVAITLRNVALAAMFILVVFPESLFDVSFQMSFAATAALVAAYESWSGRTWPRAEGGGPASRVLRLSYGYFAGVALTTVVAGIAVAPFAAFHFHRIAQYSLIGNLAAMPFVSAVIMPMALAALLAMPFGLEAWPLWIMGQGIDAVNLMAVTVSSWEGAVIRVATIPAFSLAAMVVGGLWLILWRERWRVAGLLFAGIGLAASGEAKLPDMLIGRDGAAVAVRNDAGRLAAPEGRGGTYSLERWLAAYADERSAQDIRGQGFSCDWQACVTTAGGKEIALLRHPSALGEECRRADIVVAEFPIGRHCRAARMAVDLIDLKASGAHALYLDGQSIRIETVARRRGDRPWSGSRNARPAPDADSAEDEGNEKALYATEDDQ